MTKRRIWRLLALLFAFSLIAAACGGDDDGDGADAGAGETETTAAPSDEDMADDDGDMADEDMADDDGDMADEDMADDDGDMADDDSDMADDDMAAEADRSTLEGIFAENDQRRAATVAMLSEGLESGEFGVGSDGILRGPAGFEIDMNGCPEDWSNTHGITADEIRIGHTTVQSGTLAAYGAIGFGWANYNDWVNENDPIMVGGSPRNLTLIVRDDGYQSNLTIDFVNELIESENVFSILTLGSPNTLAVYDQLNDECIPQPFVMTGHPAWGDPINHPWTTGLQLSYSLEADLWGAWIETNLADRLPVTVAALVMDNDFGLAYELGFEDWIHRNPGVVGDFVPQRVDPAQPTFTNQMTTLQAADPDVLISMTAGAPCVSVIQEAGANGLVEDIQDRGGALFTPSVCKAVANYMAPPGDASDGWWIVGGGAKDTTDPTYTGEPFITWLNANLEAGGLDPSNSLNGVGYFYGYPYVEALRVAADLPGGLTRTNFILAVRSLSIYHPLLFDGIAAEFNGAEDAYFIEGTDFSQFDVESQSWVVVGDPIDFNGQSPLCPFDRGTNSCG